MLYFYYFDGYSDKPNPQMYVVDVPRELGDYFIGIVEGLDDGAVME